jgi:hypothetical protein
MKSSVVKLFVSSSSVKIPERSVVDYLRWRNFSDGMVITHLLYFTERGKKNDIYGTVATSQPL